MVLLVSFFALCSFGHADIIAYWDFNEGSGAIAQVSSGNGNTALSQEEVQPLYNRYSAQPPTPTPPPPPYSITLPTPTWSNASLEFTIARRMSTKIYDGSDVSDQLLSNVLWAAYGHTPEGRTIQPVDDSTIIYVCRQDASYKYIPEIYTLELVKLGDDTDVGGQYNTAPVKICLIHDTNKANDVRGMVEIGKIGQNIYLEAIALGLGTITTAGGAGEAETALGLPPNESSKIIMPLGFPSSAYDFSSSPHSGNLPEVLDTGVSLELVLSDLDVATQWSDVPITNQELSNIVWAAYGTSYLYDNLNNVLHKTVPSAYSMYPFKIYVADETAAYEYDPAAHSLTEHVSGDKRQSIADASEQFVADAPVILVAGSTRYNGAYISYWDYEVGSIGHNVLLESTGLGLGANMVEVSDPDAIETALNLGFNLYHMFVMPVGHAEGPSGLEWTLY